MNLQLATAWKIAPARWHIVHTDRTFLEHREPIGIRGDAAEDERVFLGIKLRIKVVAGNRRRQSRWNGQRRLESRVTIMVG